MDSTRQALRTIFENNTSRPAQAIEAIAKEAFREGGMVNPIDPRELIFSDGEGNPTVGVELSAWQDGIRLSHIRSFTHGQGNASYVLGIITQIADNFEVPITLTPKPTATPKGVRGLKKSELTAWYKRNGFKPWPEYQGSLRREPFSRRPIGDSKESVQFQEAWIPPKGKPIPSAYSRHGDTALKIIDPKFYKKLKREGETDLIHSEGTAEALHAGWIRVAAQGFMIPNAEESTLRRLRKYLWDNYPQFANSNEEVDLEIKAKRWTFGSVPVKDLYDSAVSMQDLLRAT